MSRHPLLLILLLIIAAIAVGNHFCPYGLFRATPQWSASPTTVCGTVASQPTLTATTVRFNLHAIPQGQNIQVTVPLRSSTEANHRSDSASTLSDVSFRPGDFVALHALITLPHNAGNPGEVDYASYLRHQGITGTVFCTPDKIRNLGYSHHATIRERMLRHRQQLVNILAQYLPHQPLAVIAAMTLGDRTLITHSDRELYSRTGSSHVLALSGLHLTILYSFLLFFFTPLRRLSDLTTPVRAHLFSYLFPLVLISLLWVYVFLVGLPVSLLRAATMLTLYTLLSLFRHRTPPLHTLTLTLILLLLINPSQLFDLAFQLSAVSVAAIILTSPVPVASAKTDDISSSPQIPLLPPLLKLAQRCLSAGKALVRVSLAAQIATLPLIAYHFGRISLIGILTSFVVIPAAYIIILLTLLFFILPPFRAILATILTYTVTALHHILSVANSFPYSSIPIHFSFAFLFPATPHIAIYNQPRATEIHCVTSSTDSIFPTANPNHPRILYHAGRCIAILDRPLPTVSENTNSDSSLPVDAILVAKGARSSISTALHYFQPALIVLDGTLSPYSRNRYIQEATLLHIPIYDVATQGALILYPSQQKKSLPPCTSQK